MKKINAFTLMEVTVAMLLSAICIGICYTAFTLVGQYYATLKNRKEAVSTLLQTDQLLNRDFDLATNIIKTEKGIICETDSGLITYDFEEKFILRNQYGLRTDTLKLEALTPTFSYENKEADLQNRVDELDFNCKLKNNTTPMHYQKIYSAVNLFE